MSDSESVRDEAESARDEDLVSTLEEQESRLANAHRIAREAIDLCEQFVTRLTEMASTQKARDKAFGPSDGHIGRSEGVGALSGGEEEESSDAELSQGSDWEGERIASLSINQLSSKIQPKSK